MEVIPAINVDSFEEVKRRIKLVEPYVKWDQLDVADGSFTKNTLWHDAKDLVGLQTSVNIEVHLMINDIEKRVSDWFLAPVKRVVFHLETAKAPHLIVHKCREAKKEVGIAIGPETPWTQLARFCKQVDLFQVLAVYPGLAGQQFQERCLKKISALRENCPSAIIEVDGGVNKEIAKKVADAGADIISAASVIFNSDDIEKAIKDLCLT